MKNVRLFETTSAYESANLDYPNLSLTQDNGKLYSNLVKPIEFVDLGLPSGTKWMKCNIGAETETDIGLYFQWGSTVGYTGNEALTHSYWATCTGNGGASSCDKTALTTWGTDNLTNGVLNTNVDAAFMNTNGQAVMPTEEQAIELQNGTTPTAATIDGIDGVKLVSNTDSTKYIFMPFTGYYGDGELHNGTVSAPFYTKTICKYDIGSAYILEVNASSLFEVDVCRYEAHIIRGVQR